MPTTGRTSGRIDSVLHKCDRNARCECFCNTPCRYRQTLHVAPTDVAPTGAGQLSRTPCNSTRTLISG